MNKFDNRIEDFLFLPVLTNFYSETLSSPHVFPFKNQIAKTKSNQFTFCIRIFMFEFYKNRNSALVAEHQVNLIRDYFRIKVLRNE